VVSKSNMTKEGASGAVKQAPHFGQRICAGPVELGILSTVLQRLLEHFVFTQLLFPSFSRRLFRAAEYQLLYHHAFLDRPRPQIEYYREGGSRHIIYGLGKTGLPS